VELFAAIRRDARVEGLSIRELADRHHVHRRTVRLALGSAIPPARKTPVRVAHKLEPFKAAIDAMLTEDLDAPRKQRHTARRVLARLVDEHDAEVSYSAVRDYVAKRRPEIWAQAGRSTAQAFVPQTHEPGREAEVDFADLWVILRGEDQDCVVHAADVVLGQSGAPGLGHVRAGGVPRRPRVCVRPAGRDADLAHPLRQPEVRGRPGPQGTWPGGVRPLVGVPVPLPGSGPTTARPPTRSRRGWWRTSSATPSPT